MQRRKGYMGEHEVVQRLREAGFKTDRISPLEAGGELKGDVRLILNGVHYTISVKNGQHYPKFHYDALEGADFLFAKRNREKWLITMRIDDFIFLIKKP